jgi:acyl-CoA synthetase (AMP-forming)/AMP-acid ligase II
MEPPARILPDLLRERVEQDPARYAFKTDSAESLTSREWHEGSSRFAHGLLSRDISPGSLIVLQYASEDWVNYVIGVLGVHKAGSTVVSVPEHYSPRQRRDLVDSISPRLVVNSKSSPNVIYQFPSVEHGELIQGQPKTDIQIPITADDISEILSTSGTNGAPKLVACPHGNLTWSPYPVPTQAMQDRVTLQYAPIGTNVAQRRILNSLQGMQGLEYVMSSFDASKALRILDSGTITDIALVAVSAASLVRNVGNDRTYDSVLNIHLGASPTASSIVRDLKSVFPNATVWNRYGLTESGRLRIFCEYDPDQPRKIGGTRRGQEFQIRSDDEGDVLESGSVGELWVRDRCPYRRFYWKEHDEELETFSQGGWIRTGDLAIQAEDGTLEFVSRRSESVIVDGFKVSLPEVDEKMYGLGGVNDCASFTLQQAGGQNVLCAAVVMDANARLADIRKAAREKLNRLAPRAWFEIPGIPRTSTGKIDRNFLVKSLGKTEGEQKEHHGQS